MEYNKRKPSKQKRSLYILAMVNTAIWATAIIAMIFLSQDSPAIKNLFPILAGGVVVGVSLLSTVSQADRSLTK